MGLRIALIAGGIEEAGAWASKMTVRSDIPGRRTQCCMARRVGTHGRGATPRRAKERRIEEAVTFRWSGDEAQARRVQKEQAHHYLRWIFFAAVGAVIASLITEGLALLH